ncbi:MAG: cytochrome c biogenesis protein CcdA, partial [Planctomycetota bacterium]
EANLDVEVLASIEGQTCSTVDGSCIPYEDEDMYSRGDGKDKLFAKFPAELRPAVEAPPMAEGEDVPVFDFSFSDLRAVANLNHRIDGQNIHAVVTIDIAPDWHLYSDELGPPDAVGKVTSLELQAIGSEVVWDAPVFPAAHKTDQPFGMEGDPTWIFSHDGRLVITVSGTFEGEAPTDLDVTVDGLTCSDITLSCETYRESLPSDGNGTNAMFANFATPRDAGGAAEDLGTGTKAASSDAVDLVDVTDGEASGAVTPSDETPKGKKQQGLWAFLALCVGGGIFTLLMPCTYPMIPITISFFTKQGEKTGKAPISLSLAYGAGIVLIFVLTGAIFGPAIIQFAAHWVTNLIIGIFFVYFAMVLLGVINLQPPRFLMQAAGSASSKGGLLGVFLMGATLVITSFTCTAPIVGSILSVGAKSASGEEGDLFRLVIGMGTFGLTMAIPFVVLSLVPGKLKAIPSSGQWMNTLKKTLGFIELAAAFKFFSMVDVAFQAKVMPDEALLVIWIVTFAVTAAYLFGFVMKDGGGKIGTGRRLTGLGFLALTAYSGGILYGLERDTLMTAFLPGYTNNWVGNLAEVGDRHFETDIDNEDVAAYDRALAQALAEDKLLLVNFTGYT